MEFKEFSEFGNPEKQDYDITSSYDNPYQDELFELIGILEDSEYDHIEELYGITEEEYMHPTSDTIEKVKERLGIRKH
jgi:hypothetical protein